MQDGWYIVQNKSIHKFHRDRALCRWHVNWIILKFLGAEKPDGACPRCTHKIITGWYRAHKGKIRHYMIDGVAVCGQHVRTTTFQGDPDIPKCDACYYHPRRAES